MVNVSHSKPRNGTIYHAVFDSKLHKVRLTDVLPCWELVLHFALFIWKVSLFCVCGAGINNHLLSAGIWSPLLSGQTSCSLLNPKGRTSFYRVLLLSAIFFTEKYQSTRAYALGQHNVNLSQMPHGPLTYRTVPSGGVLRLLRKQSFTDLAPFNASDWITVQPWRGILRTRASYAEESCDWNKMAVC